MPSDQPTLYPFDGEALDGADEDLRSALDEHFAGRSGRELDGQEELVGYARACIHLHRREESRLAVRLDVAENRLKRAIDLLARVRDLHALTFPGRVRWQNDVDELVAEIRREVEG